MSGIDDLKTAIKAAQVSFDTKREYLARLQSEIAIDLARLDGMKASLDILEKADTKSSDQPHNQQSEENVKPAERQRRFRLGAKKRVVFQLVNNFATSLRHIEQAVTGYDIDPRYIREVVRTSITEGDMSGDVEGAFEITSNGIEMLQKAPLPKDWDAYNTIFEEQKAPDAQANEASNFTGEVPASPDADPFAIFRAKTSVFNQGS